MREIAVAHRISDVAAHADVALSTSLVTRHPLTLTALTAGRAPAHRARALVRACLHLPDEVVGTVESALANRLDTLTPGRIEAEVQRIALRLQPELAAQQEAGATADRTASRRALAHGQSEIILTGPAAANQRWWQALTARARALKAAGDPRSLGALRYDLAISLDPRLSPGTDPLLEVLGAGRPTPAADEDDTSEAPTEAHADGAPPGAPNPTPSEPTPDPFGFGSPLTDDRRCSRPVQASITVPASTALGLDDEPGWLDGHGWISAPLSRQLLTPAELRKACLHPVTGQLVDLADQIVRPARNAAALREAVRGFVLTPHDLRPVVTDTQGQHDPSPALEAFVQARDRYCDGPTGIAVPASRTDTDHDTPWPTGPTAGWNLRSRSPRTHHLKHYGWQAERTVQGTWWTSPAGQTVLAPAHHHRPPAPPAPGTGLPDPEQQARRDLALTRPPPQPRNDTTDTGNHTGGIGTTGETGTTARPAARSDSPAGRTPRTVHGWPDNPAF